MEGCNDCAPTANPCSGISSITYDAAVTACMSSLGITQGQPLSVVLSEIAAAICAMINPCACECDTIFLPIATYTNEVPWTDFFPLGGATEFEIEIDGVVTVIGSPDTLQDFIDELNTLDIGEVVFGASNFTITGFHLFGELSFDSNPFIAPVITFTEGAGTTCQIFTGIESKITEINNAITHDIYEVVLGTGTGTTTDNLFYFDYTLRHLLIQSDLGATHWDVIGQVASGHPQFEASVEYDPGDHIHVYQSGFVAGSDVAVYSGFTIFSQDGQQSIISSFQFHDTYLSLKNANAGAAGTGVETRWYDLDASNYSGLKCPDIMPSNIIYLFPAVLPTEGQSLKAHAPVAGVSQLYWG